MEVWKKIDGYKCYVSNIGNIKNERGYIFKISKCVHGYNKVNLTKNGVYKTYRVHRLVAEAFIPNTDNKPYVNHINGIKDDNRVENLEWCTAKENIKHAFKTGLRVPIDTIKHGRRKITLEQEEEIKNSPLRKSELCKLYPIGYSQISRIKNS